MITVPAKLLRFCLVTCFLTSVAHAANFGDAIIKSTPADIALTMANTPKTSTFDLLSVFQILFPTGNQKPKSGRLTYTVKSDNSAVASASISGDTLTVTAKAKVGSATITLTGTTGPNPTYNNKTSIASTTFKVSVADSSPPVFGTITPIDVSFTGQRSTYTLSGYAAATATSGSGACTVKSDPELNSTYTLYGNVSTYTITWTATAPSGLTATTTQSVTIRGTVTNTTRPGTVVAAVGDAVPSLTNTTYGDFSLVSINTAGEVAFVTNAGGVNTLMSNGGSGRSGAQRVILKVGDTPAGNTNAGPITGFNELKLMDNGVAWSTANRSKYPLKNPTTDADTIFANSTQILSLGDAGKKAPPSNTTSGISSLRPVLASSGAVVSVGTEDGSYFIHRVPVTATGASSVVPVLDGSGYGVLKPTNASPAPNCLNVDASKFAGDDTNVAFNSAYNVIGSFVNNPGLFAGTPGSANTVQTNTPGLSGSNVTGVALGGGKLAYLVIDSTGAHTLKFKDSLTNTNAASVITKTNDGLGHGTIYSIIRIAVDLAGNLVFQAKFTNGNQAIFRRDANDGTVKEIFYETQPLLNFTNRKLYTIRGFSVARNRIVIHGDTLPTNLVISNASISDFSEALWTVSGSGEPKVLAVNGDGVTVGGITRLITGFELQQGVTSQYSLRAGCCINEAGQTAIVVKSVNNRYLVNFDAVP